jgi:hypothetical protein
LPEVVDVNAFVHGVELIRILWKRGTGGVGDVIAASEHEIGFREPPRDHPPVKLVEPLAVHVQDDEGLRASPPHQRHHLRKVLNVHDVRLRPR